MVVVAVDAVVDLLLLLLLVLTLESWVFLVPDRPELFPVVVFDRIFGAVGRTEIKVDLRSELRDVRKFGPGRGRNRNGSENDLYKILHCCKMD